MMSFSKTFWALGLLSLVNVAQAAPIMLSGDHFTVTYDSAQTGLYGQGFLSGSLDTVYFQPSTFAALSGGSPASTAGSLQLTFSTDPGYAFAGFTFTERGDYFLFGSGTVDVAARVEAVNADTAASVLLNLAPGTPLDNTGASTPWSVTGSVASGLPQTLQVSLDNELFANAPAGELSFIQKTYVGFQIVTVAQPAAIPEPSSWALLLAGILAALMVGRRRERIPSGVRVGRRD